MNEWNNLEERMRDWQPRSPSSNIEEKLFGPTPPDREGPLLWSWRPALLGCFLLGAALFSFRGETSSSQVEDQFVWTAGSAHYAAYLSPGFSVAQNSLRNATIAWTYTKRFPSPLDIIPLMETNQFTH